MIISSSDDIEITFNRYSSLRKSSIFFNPRNQTLILDLKSGLTKKDYNKFSKDYKRLARYEKRLESIEKYNKENNRSSKEKYIEEKSREKEREINLNSQTSFED